MSLFVSRGPLLGQKSLNQRLCGLDVTRGLTPHDIDLFSILSLKMPKIIVQYDQGILI